MTTIPNTLPNNATAGIAQGISGVPPLLAKPETDVDTDLMGDPRIMGTHKLSSAEIVDSIETGNPVGLENLHLGASTTGEPQAAWLDDNGQLQLMKITTAKWMAIKEARSLNRSKVAIHQREQRELAEDRDELRKSFEGAYGLDMVDIEPYRVLLAQQFEDDPKLAMQNLVKFLRLNQIDDKKAAAVAEVAMGEAANAVAQGQYKRFAGGMNSHDATVKQRHADAVQKGKGDIEEIAMSQMHHDRRMNAIQGGSIYSPTPKNARRRPSEAYDSNVVTTYGAWLKMLAEGIPNPDGSISSFTIPHPSSPDFESRKSEILQQIQRVEGMLGWQERSNGDDMSQIMAAVNNHYSVHGEAIHIQTLQDENANLLKQIEEMEKIPEGGGIPPVMQAELDRAYHSRQARIDKYSPMDIDKSGTVKDWEQKWDQEDQEAHEKRVATAKGQRTAAKAQSGALTRAAKAEESEEKNKQSARIRKDMNLLMDGTSTSEGLEEMRSRKQRERGDFSGDDQRKLDQMESDYADLLEERKRLDEPTYEDLMAHLAGTKWEGSAESFNDAVEAKDADAVAINDRWMNYEQPQTK